MRMIRATVEYDGGRFAGYQRQAQARTVQAELEQALATIVGEIVSMVAAGRTDAGVHATGQVVSCRVATRLDDATLQRAWNARLARDVAIRSLGTVDDRFHARKSALERVYEYRIIQGPVRPVLERQRGWHLARTLDLEAMRAAAERFLGTHDFSAFTVGRQGATSRRITAIAVWREAGSVFIRVAGNAFLQRMVRRIVGTLARVGMGELKPDDVSELLRSGRRADAGPSAPAHGLTLVHVAYVDDVARYADVTEMETASR